jgi:hypothetical protein
VYFVIFLYIFLIVSVLPASAQLPWQDHVAPGIVTYSNVDLANPFNSTAALNRRLAAWYLELPQVNDRGLTLRNIVRSGHNGTLTSMATPATTTSGRGLTTLRGMYGEWRLDGTNDYIDLGNFRQAGEMTVSAWFNSTTVAAGTREIVADEFAGSNEDYDCEINRTAGKLTFGWGAHTIVTGTVALSANTWYFGAWVRSGVAGAWTAKIYVNGLFDNSATTAFDPNGSNAGNKVSIGRLGASANFFFSGKVTDVRIYPRVLSATEVMQLMVAG